MIYIVLIFSFYLEGVLSHININLLTTLISLILIYPYLFNHKKKYFIICFITGLIYDIAYTNTFLLNASLFLLIGYIISIINIYITNNNVNIVIISILVITLYRIFTYIILVFINYLKFNINILLNSIFYSILFNIIYIFLMYEITSFISKKRGIYKKD